MKFRDELLRRGFCAFEVYDSRAVTLLDRGGQVKTARIVTMILLARVVSLGFGNNAGQIPRASGEDEIRARAKTIHERVISLDTHIDIFTPYATAEADPGAENYPRQCSLPKMERGGLKGVFLAVFVNQRRDLDESGYKYAHDAAMAKFEAIHRLPEKMYPNRCEFAASPADVLRIARTGRRIIMIGMENGYPIGEDLALIRKYFELGARYITLCHGGHNQICDSSSIKEPLHNGLSAFGRKVVKEMNRLGIMVDVSHISEKSFWDVLTASNAPIIASHSGCAALTPHDRNLTDDQLKALSRNGGVLQVVAVPNYLKGESPERREAMESLRTEIGLSRLNPEEMQKLSEAQRAEWTVKWRLYQERMKEVDAKFPQATLADFANHIDHAVKVAGIDHVGIGSDFDGGGGVSGFRDVSEALNVTIELVRRGYSEADIGKIWGGNLLRVWKAVENASSHASVPRQ
jgi:membrane dipeptidase